MFRHVSKLHNFNQKKRYYFSGILLPWQNDFWKSHSSIYGASLVNWLLPGFIYEVRAYLVRQFLLSANRSVCFWFLFLKVQYSTCFTGNFPVAASFCCPRMAPCSPLRQFRQYWRRPTCSYTASKCLIFFFLFFLFCFSFSDSLVPLKDLYFHTLFTIYKF